LTEPVPFLISSGFGLTFSGSELNFFLLSSGYLVICSF
jgi:hypothetical protein